MEQVVQALADRGVQAVAVDENGADAVEVPCGEDGMPDCADLGGVPWKAGRDSRALACVVPGVEEPSAVA